MTVDDVDPVATANVMPLSSELEKETPLGKVPYVHVIVPVYSAVWLTLNVAPADDAITYGDALVRTGVSP